MNFALIPPETIAAQGLHRPMPGTGISTLCRSSNSRTMLNGIRGLGLAGDSFNLLNSPGNGTYGLGVPHLRRLHQLTVPASALPALNLATFLALILIVAPVCGLRPVRAARLLTENEPKPDSDVAPASGGG